MNNNTTNIRFVWGGWGSSRTDYNQLHYLNFEESSWGTWRRGKPPKERFGHSVVCVGDKAFMFGGNLGKEGFTNQLQIVDVSSVY